MTTSYHIANSGPPATHVRFAFAGGMPPANARFRSGRPLTQRNSHAFESMTQWVSGHHEELLIDGLERLNLFRVFAVDAATDGQGDLLVQAAAVQAVTPEVLRRQLATLDPSDPQAKQRHFFLRLAEEDSAPAFVPTMVTMQNLLGDRIQQRASHARFGLRVEPFTDRRYFKEKYGEETLACLALVDRVVHEVFGNDGATDSALTDAMERFVDGRLTVLEEVVPGPEGVVVGHAAPNSVFFLYLSELLLLSKELAIPKASKRLPWLRAFVHTAHAFIELYWDHRSRHTTAYSWRDVRSAALDYPWDLVRRQFATATWDELEEALSRLCLFAFFDSVRHRPFQPHWRPASPP